MWQYIVKRLLLMLPTLIGAALLVFLLMRVVPGLGTLPELLLFRCTRCGQVIKQLGRLS